MDWFATLVGLSVVGRLLLSDNVTGGGASAKVKETDTFIFQGVGTAARSSVTPKGGWAVGGGIEAYLWGAWTGKIEYQHINSRRHDQFGCLPTSLLGLTSGLIDHSELRTDLVRVGLNYKFGWLR